MTIMYYILQLFVVCKPFSLHALLKGDIPQPGIAYYKHVQISKSLQTQSRKSVTPELSEIDSDIDDDEKSFLVNNNNNNKKSFKKIKDEAQKERMAILTKRYENFNYKYIDVKADYFIEKLKKKNKKYDEKKYNEKYHDLTASDNIKLAPKIPKAFFNNYKNYWLNVYRPFDEYDMNNVDRQTMRYIFGGFKYVKAIAALPMRIMANRRKKGSKSKNNNVKKNKTCCGSFCQFIKNGCKFFMNSILIILLLGFFLGGFYGSLIFNDKNAKKNFVVANVTNIHQTYPICTEMFGSKINNYAGHSVHDMMFLTSLTYEMDDYNATQMVKKYFGDDFEVLYENFQDKKYPKFIHIINTKHSISFLAVRGTASAFDMLQDMSLFLEVAAWDFLSVFIPFLNVVPTSILRHIIFFASLPEGIINAHAREEFTHKIRIYLENYIENNYGNNASSTNIINKNEEVQLYIVGHSLGGAIAASVAAQLYENTALTHNIKNGNGINIHSFGVNSPGTALSSKKFGYNIDSLYLTSTSILAYRDLVSRVDVHGGVIQYVSCPDNYEVYQCHKVHAIICEVARHCANINNKNVDCFCDKNFKGKREFGKCLGADAYLIKH